MILRRAFCLFLLIGLVVRLSAAATPEENFFFVQLSDTQFGMFNNDISFEKETAQVEQIVARMNLLKPAFVIVTGDLVNRAGDAAQIAEYHRIFAKMDPAIPLYSVPGNHDFPTETTPESLAAYRKEFGRDYYSFRRGNMAGIVLNSNLLTAPAKVLSEAAAMDTWMKAEFKKLKSEGVQRFIVFMHHPLFLEKADEADAAGFRDIPQLYRKPLIAVLKEYGVAQVFAGHLHRNNLAKDDGIESVATSAAGRPLGADPSGIRVVIVRPTGVEHTFYPLDAMPASVSVVNR